jgi:hypothetical protein
MLDKTSRTRLVNPLHVSGTSLPFGDDNTISASNDD